MAKPVWGIELGTSSIKAVKMAATKEGLEIQALDVFDLPPVDEELEQSTVERLAVALVEFRDRHAVKAEPCWISIPGHQTFNKIISLPYLDPKKFTETVGYEAQQQMPVSMSSIIWDYQMLERNPQVGADVEVALFAVRREIVSQYVNMMREIGLQLAGIQVAPLAIYNFMKYDQQKWGRSGIIVDIGAESTDLLILDDHKVWMRNLPTGGNDITEELANKFGITKTEAEELKRRAARSPQAPKIFNLMKPTLRDLLGEIHRSMGFYKSQNEEVRLSAMMLMGSGSHLLGLKKFFEQQLQFRVEKLARLRRLQLARTADPELLQTHITTLPVALGLAIQGMGEGMNTINLVPEHIKRAGQLQKRFFVAVAAAVILVLASVLPGLGVGNLGEQGAEAKSAKRSLDSQITNHERDWKAAVDVDYHQGLMNHLEAFEVPPIASLGEEIFDECFNRMAQPDSTVSALVREENAEFRPLLTPEAQRLQSVDRPGEWDIAAFREFLRANGNAYEALGFNTEGHSFYDFSGPDNPNTDDVDERRWIDTVEAQEVRGVPRWRPTRLNVGIADFGRFPSIVGRTRGMNYLLDDFASQVALPGIRNHYRSAGWSGEMRVAVPIDDARSTRLATFRLALAGEMRELLDAVIVEALANHPSVEYGPVSVDAGIEGLRPMRYIFSRETYEQEGGMNLYQVVALAFRLDWRPTGVGRLDRVAQVGNERRFDFTFSRDILDDLRSRASDPDDPSVVWDELETFGFTIVDYPGGQTGANVGPHMHLKRDLNSRLRGYLESGTGDRFITLTFVHYPDGARSALDLATLSESHATRILPEPRHLDDADND